MDEADTDVMCQEVPRAEETREVLRESLWGHSRQREEQALREVDSGDVTEMSNQGEV